MRIAIIGAGPGGLTLANALLSSPIDARRRFDVEVFDRLKDIQPQIGGGIQINGGRKL